MTDSQKPFSKINCTDKTLNSRITYTKNKQYKIVATKPKLNIKNYLVLGMSVWKFEFKIDLKIISSILETHISNKYPGKPRLVFFQNKREDFNVYKKYGFSFVFNRS